MDGAHDTARLFLGSHGVVRRSRKAFQKGFALSPELRAPARDSTYLAKGADGRWALSHEPGGLRIRFEDGRFFVSAAREASINMKKIVAETQINPRDDLTYLGDRFSFRHVVIEQTLGQKRKLSSEDAPSDTAEPPSPS